MLGQALLEADLGGQVQCPQAGILPEGAGAAMEQGPQALGGLGREGGVRRVRQRGTVLQGVEPAFVESMQGIEYRLVVAAELLGDARSAFAASTGEQDLAAAQHEGIAGAQAALEGLPLRVRQRTDKNGVSHRVQDTTFSPTLYD